MTENMTEEERDKLGEAMKAMLSMINPHLEDVLMLAKALSGINKIESKLDLPKEIDEKLLNISIDLYAVIKNIQNHFNMDERTTSATDQIILKGGE